MSEDPVRGDGWSDETVEAGPRDGEGPSGASPVPTETQELAPSVAGVPKRIGQYRIKRAIASGGMGTVYEALQEKPRRTVAVKLMRAGIASRSALRRFEYESQLLARLRHNGIAQVYDAGTHKDGEVTVPYFAMEYIVGAKPITEYAEQEQLGTRERMKLFTDVCEAVHHGHQKGIIHRDLKPSNILVDSSGQVKIIDFGVARSTDSDMAVTTLQTDVGQLIGTLQYMSPEQCAADPHDIDTRSDVYALGVILFEMLCQQLPYDLKGAAIHEATRVIREQEPTKLSSYNKTLRGDVETITFKALEKNRNRRYQSASALVADIQRYLNNEPISARPASAMYQFRKLVSRHKTATAAALAVLLALTAGMIVSDVQRRRALRAEALAELMLQDAEAARDAAQASQAEAEAVTNFLTDTLASVDPEKQGKDVSVREVLDVAAEKIGETFADRPLVEARIRKSVGWTYRSLGLYERAQAHLADAAALYQENLGERHPKTLGALNNLAIVVDDRGDYGTSEAHHRATLEVQRRAFGEEHPNTLASMQNLASTFYGQGRYAEAAKLNRQTLEIRRRTLGEEHPSTLGSMNNLANCLFGQGRYAEAEALERQTLEIRRRTLGEEHPKTLMSMNNLATSLSVHGRYAEAEALLRQALEIQRRALGEEHPETLRSMHNLANCVFEQGRYAKSEALHRQTLEIRRRVSGKEHPETLLSMESLARSLYGQGRYAEAEALYRKTLEISRRALGKEHPSVTNTLTGLGTVLIELGELAEAQSLLEEALAIRQAVHLDDSLEVADTKSVLGACLTALGQFDKAEPLLLNGYDKLKSVQGESGFDTLEGLKRIVKHYDAWHAAEPGKGYDVKAANWRGKLPKQESSSDE